ncbi:spore germination protein [Evansella halocellulosilytica]|uniref:spore germination protein n=1 Tax=Evansella halocellulosilytica TaxID=2011013 RepID=UPI00211BDD58|nr:spore germination protein [Evansella halocellulosilytica]
MDKSLHVVFMYLLIHIGLILFMYPADIIDSVSRTHWLPILIGVVVHITFIWIFMKGLSFFENKSIVDIYFEAGKGISFIFLVPVMIYFLLVTITTVSAHSEIINIAFLSETPDWAIIVLFLVIAAYIATKGVEAILRTGLLIALLFFPLTIFIYFMSFQNVDWRYFFPLFDIDYSFLTERSYYKSYFAFTGGFLFLGFVQPYFYYNRKKVLLAALLLIPFFLFAVYTPILTFGQATSATLHFPFILVLDSIYIHWLIFDRVTMFFLLSLIIFIMLLVSLVLWKMSRIMTGFFPKLKPNYIIYFLTVLTFVVCLIIPNWNDIDKLFWWNTFFRFYSLLVVPISIYILGWRSQRKGNVENG